jgi:hypothetical protein
MGECILIYGSDLGIDLELRSYLSDAVFIVIGIEYLIAFISI